MISHLKRFIRYIDSYSPYPVFYPFMMKKAEKEMFDAYIKQSNIYLEFGAGGTTIRALQKSNAKVFCVESSAEWTEHIKSYTIVKKNHPSRLHFHYADIGPTKEFGYPIHTENPQIFEKYIVDVFDNFESSFPDTILIDGRFRVACALKSLIEATKKGVTPTLLFHDFWSREHYHIILKFVDVINQVDELGVFKPKTDLLLTELEACYQNYISTAD